MRTDLRFVVGAIRLVKAINPRFRAVEKDNNEPPSVRSLGTTKKCALSELPEFFICVEKVRRILSGLQDLYRYTLTDVGVVWLCFEWEKNHAVR